MSPRFNSDRRETQHKLGKKQPEERGWWNTLFFFGISNKRSDPRSACYVPNDVSCRRGSRSVETTMSTTKTPKTSEDQITPNTLECATCGSVLREDKRTTDGLQECVRCGRVWGCNDE